MPQAYRPEPGCRAGILKSRCLLLLLLFIPAVFPLPAHAGISIEAPPGAPSPEEIAAIPHETITLRVSIDVPAAIGNDSLGNAFLRLDAYHVASRTVTAESRTPLPALSAGESLQVDATLPDVHCPQSGSDCELAIVARVVAGHILMDGKAPLRIVSPVLRIDGVPDYVDAETPVPFTATVTATAQTLSGKLTARIRNHGGRVLSEGAAGVSGAAVSDGVVQVNGEVPGPACGSVPVCRVILEVEAAGVGSVSRPLVVRGRTHLANPNIGIDVPRVIEDGPLPYDVTFARPPVTGNPGDGLVTLMLFERDTGTLLERWNTHYQSATPAAGGRYTLSGERPVTACPGQAISCELVFRADVYGLGVAAYPVRWHTRRIDHPDLTLDVPAEAELGTMVDYRLDFPPVPAGSQNAASGIVTMQLLDQDGTALWSRGLGRSASTSTDNTVNGRFTASCPARYVSDCELVLRAEIDGHGVVARPVHLLEDLTYADSTLKGLIAGHYLYPGDGMAQQSLRALRHDHPLGYNALLDAMGRRELLGVGRAPAGVALGGSADPLHDEAFLEELRVTQHALFNYLVEQKLLTHRRAAELVYWWLDAGWYPLAANANSGPDPARTCEPWIPPTPGTTRYGWNNATTAFLAMPRKPVDCRDYTPGMRRVLEDLVWRSRALNGDVALNDTDDERFWPAYQAASDGYVHGEHNRDHPVFYAAPDALPMFPARLTDHQLAAMTDDPLGAAVMNLLLIKRLFLLGHLWSQEHRHSLRQLNDGTLRPDQLNHPFAYPAELELVELIARRLTWMEQQAKEAMKQAYAEWHDKESYCRYYKKKSRFTCELLEGINPTYFSAKAASERADEILQKRMESWPVNEKALTVTSALLELINVVAAGDPDAQLPTDTPEPFSQDVKDAIDALLVAAGEEPADWETWEAEASVWRDKIRYAISQGREDAIPAIANEALGEFDEWIDGLDQGRGLLSLYTRSITVYGWIFNAVTDVNGTEFLRKLDLKIGKHVNLGTGGVSAVGAVGAIVGLASAALQFKDAQVPIEYAKAAFNMAASLSSLELWGAYAVELGLSRSLTPGTAATLGSLSSVAYGFTAVFSIASGIIIMLEDNSPASIASGASTIMAGTADLAAAATLIFAAAYNATMIPANAGLLGAGVVAATVGGIAAAVSAAASGIAIGAATLGSYVTMVLEAEKQESEFKALMNEQVEVTDEDVLRMLSSDDPDLIGRIFLALHLAV